MSETVFITDSLGRSIELKKLTTADQFDLLEAARNRADYTQWFGLAALVFSCMAIDGVPLPSPRKPDDFKKNALVLKDEGIKAVANYFAEKAEAEADAKTEDAQLETAKN